ncbi:LAME_0H10968g1_1 [Lachancea meyersii CBS 8951]|uniref:t-SNARE affecting a late Golgi compartment protein 1 n=1 Tax=Lachancea meyersii CBS 8951 TaxID=1266667 RepID=A0A1G4KG80_9SACH|nr:LAME_0H10968g1_1 [Lachancea meyersii CBS 8951]
MDDPFEQVLSDTHEQTNRLIQYLDGNHEIDDEIRDIFTDLEETVRELDSSILVMKRDGYVNDDLIMEREERMQALKRDVARLKAQIPSQRALENPASNLDFDVSSSSETSDLQTSNPMQQEMLQEQDQHLDTIQQSMRNLHLQASTMGQELEDQGVMLDEMDGSVDNVMSKLSRGRRQLEWVYEKNKEKFNDCCIGLLIVALIVLLVLAFVL